MNEKYKEDTVQCLPHSYHSAEVEASQVLSAEAYNAAHSMNGFLTARIEKGTPHIAAWMNFTLQCRGESQHTCVH